MDSVRIKLPSPSHEYWSHNEYFLGTYFISKSVFGDNIIMTARKRSLRRLYFYMCLSVILFMGRGSPGPHQLGRLGDWPGGVSRLTPRGIQAHTLGVQVQVWGGSRSRSGGGSGVGLGEVYPSMHWGRHTPSQQTATAAGGTHPTGIRACFNFILCINISSFHS